MLIPARFSLISFVLALSSAALAQPPSAPAGRRIVLDVVVTPKTGAPVSGLTQQDFTIIDNKTPQPITSFAAVKGPDAPITIIIVMDTVNADPVELTYQRQDLDKFLKSNGGHLVYPTLLAVLQNAGIAMGESPTTNGNLLSAALNQTNLGSGVDLKRTGSANDADRAHRSLVAAEQLVVKEAAVPGRKIILWVSPGWPLVSDANLNYDEQQSAQLFHQAVVMTNLLRRANVTFYSVSPATTDASVFQLDYQQFLKGVAKPNQGVPGYTGLQVLSTQSGGLAIPGSNDIASQLDRCIADLSAYYEITYDAPPDERRDALHTIQIKVSQPGLTARTHTIYYSQP